MRGEQSVQIVHLPGLAPVEVIDLSRAQDAEEQVLQLQRKEDSRLFNLEKGPLFHITLLRLSPLDHRIIFTLHHLLYDAAALEIINEEFSALYTAYSRGEPSLTGGIAGAGMPILPHGSGSA